MGLDSALATAGTGIDAIQTQLALISQNVANAGTPTYATEVAAQEAVTAGGTGMGVRLLPATRLVDTALQATLLGQNAATAGAQTTATALSAINSVQGTPGAGNDLPSLLAGVTSAFTTLAGDPSAAASQQAVVTAAQTLTNGINTISQSYQQQRQTAQDGIVSAVGAINADLGTIGTLSDQIINLKSLGQSTADLENQRDSAVASLSSLVSVRTLAQPNGDMLVIAGGGLTLPTHATNPLTTSGAQLGATATYPGSIPAIKLGGTDVTAALTGGTLGASITLRDKTLPTYQAELDQFSAQLSNRFAAQGLSLFTRGDGSLPASTGPYTQSGYVGYAGQITVNPAVAASPSLVRDGNLAIAGSPTGASAFTPNPAGGPAAFGTLISRVLDYALGSNAQVGVAQPATPTSGLGPSGTLAAPYAAPADLTGLASTMIASQSADSATASAQASSEASVQTTLSSRLASQDGVNMDQELAAMTQLQNAYGANARVISAVQSMFTTLLMAITPVMG